MNDATALTAVLCAGERDKTPALMLADLLIETEGFGKFRALREVGQLRRAAFYAGAVCEALELVKPTCPASDALIGLAMFEAGATDDFYPVQWVIESGRRPPRVALAGPGVDPARGPHYFITAGALWVIRTTEELRWEPSNFFGSRMPRRQQGGTTRRRGGGSNHE